MIQNMERENQEGAIVIEATISLTAFMFLIVTILSIVNICLAQAKVGALIHGVAKDISNYTYIYTMAGLNEKEKAISGKADYSRNKIDNIIEGSEDVMETVQKVGDAVLDSEFWSSMTNLILESAVQEVKGEVIDGVCRMVSEKRLSGTGYDADRYLRKLGVVGGLDGLAFSESSFCSGGSDDIKIIVQYDVSVLKLFNIDFRFHFEQCAYTKAWCARTYSFPNQGDQNESDH